MRCSVDVDRVSSPVRVCSNRVAAPNVLPNWGLHEKYHQKQTLGWDWAGAGRLGHRRRGDFPERSRRKRAGRDGHSGTRGPAGFGLRRRAPADRAWDEFSGRLEAVERVEIRSRVAGAIQAIHFREGALVKQGDLLITDRSGAVCGRCGARRRPGGRGPGARDPHQERVRARPADCRIRARSRSANSTIASTPSARPKPICGRPQAALQTAKLNLGYTEVRAPVSGRVGKLEITVGNLIAAGPGTPVLTTLVSVSPIYASFNADEQVVTRALQDAGGSIGTRPRSDASRCRWAPAPATARRTRASCS